jgi:hypothetical protein
MSKLFRALLISAIATGTAAVVLKMVRPETAPTPRPKDSTGPYVDADAMTDEQRDLLMQELETLNFGG